MKTNKILWLLLLSGLFFSFQNCSESFELSAPQLGNENNSSQSQTQREDNSSENGNEDENEENENNDPSFIPPDTTEYIPTPFTPVRTVNVNSSSSLVNALLNVQPGDDIVIANGEYIAPNSGQDPGVEHERFSGGFYPASSGTEAQPIRIRAANPGMVSLTLAPNPSNLGPIFSIGGKSHIIVSGIIFEAEQSAIRQDTGFVAINDSNHIYFEDNVMNGSAPAVPFVNNHSILYIQNVTQSRIANNRLHNISNTPGSHNGEGIIMYGVNRTVFEFNTSTQIGGVAIYLKGDRTSFGEQAHYGNIIRKNFATQCGVAIQVTSNGQFVQERSLIYQNLSNECERGTFLHGWTNYIDVFNNTAVNSNAGPQNEYTGGVVIAGVVETGNNRVWGNLVYGVTADFESWRRSYDYFDSDANYTSDYNWSQSGLRFQENLTNYSSLTDAQTAGYEMNSVEGDNPFMDLDGGDFRLNPDNYDAGSFVPDLSGIFGQAVPAGCYISENDQIGRIPYQ